MKKWFFISAIFLVIAYFVQIFYIGKLNQEFFNNLAKENEIYKIDNLNFNKGFFKSSASFDLILKDERYNSFNIKDKIPVFIKINNNFFAKNNLEVDFTNPFKDLDVYLTNSLLAKIFINVSLNYIDVNVKFSDLNISDDMFFFKAISKDANLNINLNQDIFVNNVKFNAKFIDLQFANGENMSFENIFYEDKYDVAIPLSVYLMRNIEESIMNISVDNIIYNEEYNLKNLTLNNKVKFNDDNETFNDKLKLKISNINMKSKFHEQNLSNLDLDLKINNIFKDINSQTYLDEQDYYEKLLSYRPNFVLDNFSFSSYDKNVSVKADVLMENYGYKANINVVSDDKMSKIFPISIIFGADDYFIEKDGKYEMNIVFDNTDLNSTKFNINGKDISNLTVD